MKKMTNSQVIAIIHTGSITHLDNLMTMFATELGMSSLKGGDSAIADQT